MNHIGDTNKMVSETPISDSTPHNVGDLGMQIRRLERQLNAANERIKRLEEAGDAMADMMIWSAKIIERESPSALAWLRAKDDKL